jgi:hypothetical protein
VDDLFALRFGRLLSAVRQAVLTDPEVLYWPMYRHTMMDFIEERTGRVPDWKEVLSWPKRAEVLKGYLERSVKAPVKAPAKPRRCWTRPCRGQTRPAR